MLYAVSAGAGEVTLVLMHFLGGSGREWDEVVALLGGELRTLAVDLPGFGGSADVPGYSVAEMADAVEALLGHEKRGRFVLVGHSMSSKVAAVLARRNADDPTRLYGLAGLVLVAASPPGPEPMAEGKREQMLASLGAVTSDDRERARAFITKNGERDIPAPVVERAVDEVLKMNRAAWRAWVEHGSREDWAERVGVLGLPVLLVAGEKDRSLGPEPQRISTLPHFVAARLHVLPGCSHLVPMERPHEMAALLREFVDALPA